jgi:hypothetical protein
MWTVPWATVVVAALRGIEGVLAVRYLPAD